jgi:gliding motility-associated-like protein
MKLILVFSFTVLNIAALGQVNLNLGLRAYYPFSGNASDASGNNNNPVFNNAVLTVDHWGTSNSAYHFDGLSNYMKILNSTSLNMTNKMSIAVWVKPMGFYNGTCHNNMLVAKGDVDFQTGNYSLRFTPNPLGGCVSNPPFSQSVFYGVNAIATTPFVQLNKWYSVVWTSDGTTAKMYVDCELKASVPAGSNTFTNTDDLFIGKFNNGSFPYWFNGDLDEVRIYNRELNIDEVKAYGECNRLTSGVNISGIINTYTPVLALDPCANKITVEDASTFTPGDTVLMIQMKGAIIDSSNTVSFGTITEYKNAGNYELNYVKSKTGNTIELLNKLTRQYDIPGGKVQLIRVPYYNSVNIISTLTCLPWDGNKAGVLVLNVRDTINLVSNIDASGKGFRGGTGFNSQNPVLNCFQNNYSYPQTSNAIAGQKGETMASPSQNINYGKGSPASGGGGGLGHNSGGGGGANGGAGGSGGYQLDACGNSPFDNRGIGGHTLIYNTTMNKIFAGGGGGAGQADNPGNIPPDGGNGGGIIIILSNFLKSNGNTIISNGNAGQTCTLPASPDCHDAMGGGGAGGSILLGTSQFIDNILIENKGGKGADMVGSVALGGRIGAGGGGGGGLLFLKSSSPPPTLFNTNTGGINGVLTTDANNAYGATAGQNGITLFNLVVPIDNILFKPNIDSVRIAKRLVTCDSFDFNGVGYTNTNPVVSWQWYFGDGGTATAQNTGHTFAAGSYTVKLVVTDINGCKDSITTSVTATLLDVNAGPDKIICSPNSAILEGVLTNASQFQWTPAVYLNNSSIPNPIATPPVTTMFYLTATNATGCSKKDSVLISVRSANGFTINPPADICINKSIQLSASGGDIYAWQPAGTLNNPAIFNPIATPGSTILYNVFITDTVCHNSTTLFTTITTLPLPLIKATKTNDIDCSTPQSQLSASGGIRYTWTPTGSLSNANTAAPVASPVVTTQYFVSGTNQNSCTNLDSIIVKVSADNKGGYFMPNGFTPNNDGLNDCFGVKLWGTIIEIDFTIYNRWGQLIFHTRRIGDCWNGYYRGVLQTPDVYVYMIKAKTTCESAVFRKGTFVLIR